MSTNKRARASSRGAGVAKAEVTPASSIGAAAFAERQAANSIAGIVGCDHRTALRAMRFGADVVRTMKLREELRPHVDAWRARIGVGQERAAS